MRGYRAAFLSGVLSLLAASSAVGQGKAPDPDDFRIGPEDTLVISVWQNGDLSRVVPVRPDGKISLPLIDDVVAAGLTPIQLADSLKKKLTEYVPNAVVNVLVQEVNSYKISIIGRVQHSGRFTLRSPTTVLEALALAGGFQEDASTDEVVVLRPERFPVKTGGTGKIYRRIRFNYKRVVSTGGETENFSLLAGDIVVVQ